MQKLKQIELKSGLRVFCFYIHCTPCLKKQAKLFLL